MKRFKYRLERLLSIRRVQERARAREVAALLATETLHQKLVQASEDRRAAAELQIAELRGSIRSAGIQLAADNLFRAIRRDVRREREAQAMSKKKTDEARHAFVEARQRTMVLEKLRIRRERDWRHDAERNERRHDDEIAENIRRRKVQL